jgi:hypothetical protein
MKKGQYQFLLGILLIVAVVVSVIAVMFAVRNPIITEDQEDTPNISPNTLSDTPNPEVFISAAPSEMLVALEAMTQKDLEPMVVASYVSMLDMRMYGRNDRTAMQMYNQENTKNMNDGYITEGGYSLQIYPGGLVISQWWHKDDIARAISVAEGANVRAYYGFNTVYLKSEGSLVSYWQLWNYIKSRPPL